MSFIKVDSLNFLRLNNNSFQFESRESSKRISEMEPGDFGYVLNWALCLFVVNGQPEWSIGADVTLYPKRVYVL